VVLVTTFLTSLVIVQCWHRPPILALAFLLFLRLWASRGVVLITTAHFRPRRYPSHLIHRAPAGSQVVAPPNRRDAFLLPSARNARIPPQWRPRARRSRCRPPPSSAGPPGERAGSPRFAAAPSEVSAALLLPIHGDFGLGGL
jgi:hypothetical protein